LALVAYGEVGYVVVYAVCTIVLGLLAYVYHRTKWLWIVGVIMALWLLMGFYIVGTTV